MLDCRSKELFSALRFRNAKLNYCVWLLFADFNIDIWPRNPKQTGLVVRAAICRETFTGIPLNLFESNWGMGIGKTVSNANSIAFCGEMQSNIVSSSWCESGNTK